MENSESLVRHGWAWLRPDWCDFLRAPLDAVARSIIEHWRCEDLPFVVASTACSGSARHIRLGLVTVDKQRIGFELAAEACLKTAPPPTLNEAAAIAPVAWQDKIERTTASARTFGFQVCVYGSLAWSYRANVMFLRTESDLDLLLAARSADPEQIYAFLKLLQTDQAAPVLDGELLLHGGAVAWRELAQRPAQLLVKHSSGLMLCSRAQVEAMAFEMQLC